MCPKKCPDNHEVTGCYGCDYQEKWVLTNIFVCSQCGYVSEYLSYDIPEDDNCPQCKAAGLSRQVRIGDSLVDFDPTQHN